MAKQKYRTCKNCKTRFPRPERNPLQTWCKPQCGFELSKKAQVKAAERKAAKERRELRERKIALKSWSDWNSEAQAAVNKYIRWRDFGCGCISCGNLPAQLQGGTMDAGHFCSRGASSHLRFNLLNIHAQCVRCNRRLSGNIGKYRVNLIDKIGLVIVERLECDNKPRKYSIPELQRIKKIFNRRARWYQRRRESEVSFAA